MNYSNSVLSSSSKGYNSVEEKIKELSLEERVKLKEVFSSLGKSLNDLSSHNHNFTKSADPIFYNLCEMYLKVHCTLFPKDESAREDMKKMCLLVGEFSCLQHDEKEADFFFRAAEKNGASSEEIESAKSLDSRNCSYKEALLSASHAFFEAGNVDELCYIRAFEAALMAKECLLSEKLPDDKKSLYQFGKTITETYDLLYKCGEKIHSFEFPEDYKPIYDGDFKILKASIESPQSFLTEKNGIKST